MIVDLNKVRENKLDKEISKVLLENDLVIYEAIFKSETGERVLATFSDRATGEAFCEWYANAGISDTPGEIHLTQGLREERIILNWVLQCCREDSGLISEVNG